MVRFTYSEFVEFCHLKGIFSTILMYYPSSNGLAEHTIQIFKKDFKKMLEGSMQVKIFVFSFLLHIANPQTTMGMSLVELLMSRTLRSRLHLSVGNKQEQKKLSNDKRAVERTCVDGKSVCKKLLMVVW